MKNTIDPDIAFKKATLERLINAYDEAISHYDFVIQDISSEIYNPVLQATKEPVLAFLTAMHQEWVKCRNEAQKQLDNLQPST